MAKLQKHQIVKYMHRLLVICSISTAQNSKIYPFKITVSIAVWKMSVYGKRTLFWFFSSNGVNIKESRTFIVLISTN